MPHRINGVDIACPETSGWISREDLGNDGNGRPIYPRFRNYELKWGLMSLADYKQIQDYYNVQAQTGTLVVDLPQYGGSAYTFFSYTGCIIKEPAYGEYFNEYYSDVVLVVTRIRT